MKPFIQRERWCGYAGVVFEVALFCLMSACGGSNGPTLGPNVTLAPVVSGVSPSTGPTTGGTEVEISGHNFQTGATVSFGDTPATSVTVVSATQINATTPAHAASSVAVTVTNPGGESAMLSQAFTFGSGSTCGPPAYCSRTDLQTVQLPGTTPNVGQLIGANTIITDPDFSNRIVRVTDANTNPAKANFTYVTTGGSADENIWNEDSTMFVITDTGGSAYPFSFDPVAMQASRLYVSSFPSTNGFVTVGQGSWSHTNNNVLYLPDVASRAPIIDSLDFTDRSTPPSPQVVYNFTTSPNCLPSGLAGGTTFTIQGGTSKDDTVFAMAYSSNGGQNTAAYVGIYKVGSGCRWYNTSTGQVGGDWGPSGSVNVTDTFTIHNVKISKDGQWAVIVSGGCLTSSCNGHYFWQIGTTQVNVCPQLCDGHFTEGYTHWVNNSTNTQQAGQVIRPFSNTAGTSQLISNFPTGFVPPWDTHQSWNNVDSADSLPVFQSIWSPVTPFPTAWYNEIQGVAADGSGTVWRFAHNFITAQSQRFSTKYGIGSVSQDGKFFIFSSDWLGTVGSESGASGCTIGADCRGDVFVVELK